MNKQQPTPYNTPELIVYGDVASLTKTRGTSSQVSDGGSACGQNPCKTR